jgi:hypothetical protein
MEMAPMPKPKHDVIFYSGRGWEWFAAPHRIALALAQLGCKVLFCEVPVSSLRKAPRQMLKLENGICVFQPAFLSARLYHLPLARTLQAKAVIRQVERAAAECGLQDPIFLYCYAGDSAAVCRGMSKRFFSVHISTDHSPGLAQREQDELVALSDKTLVIPPSRYHQLTARFGGKISLIPQAVDFTRLTRAATGDETESPAYAGIPRPRLGFFGNVGVLNRPLLRSILEPHPDWHFVSAGSKNAVDLANSHVLPWTDIDGLRRYMRGLDAGLMLYDCFDEQYLHCVPLKMFECFALGIPVVATPLVHLWEYRDLLYLGDTAEELASGVQKALAEPADSPKRAARIEVARRHSIESLAEVLGQVLPLGTEPVATSNYLDLQAKVSAS